MIQAMPVNMVGGCCLLIGRLSNLLLLILLIIIEIRLIIVSRSAKVLWFEALACAVFYRWNFSNV